MSKARDIADLDFNSPDIDGGNIDGATIGGTTPAAGTFTGLTVDGTISAYRAGYTQGVQLLGDSGGNQIIGTATNDKKLIIKNQAATQGIELVAGNKAINIAHNGDISFYEDTGSSPKMVWSASTQKLTIDGNGTTVTNLSTAISQAVLELNGNSQAGSDALYFGTKGGTGASYLQTSNGNGTAANYPLLLNPYGGNVGINETNPDAQLHILGTGATNGATIKLQENNNNTTDNLGTLLFGNNVDDSLARIQGYTHTNNTTSALNFGSTNTGTNVRNLDLKHNEVVLNENGSDIDFRVESDGNDHMLFVDGGNDKVLINKSSTNAPSTAKLNIDGGVHLNFTGEYAMSWKDGTYSNYYKGMTGENLGTGTGRGLNIFNHDSDSDLGITFWSGSPVSTNKYEIACFKAGPNGEVVFNDTGLDKNFRVGSDNNANMLFVDGGDDFIGIGTSTDALYDDTSGTAAVLSASSNYPHTFNRQTGSAGSSVLLVNDTGASGHAIQVRTDGVISGNIGVESAGIYLSDSTYGGIKAAGNAYQVVPATASGAAYDNSMYLGANAARWKRVYVSEGLQFGTTSAAGELLDDYEEGTWFPTFSEQTAGTGTYTKIGRSVQVWGEVVCDANGAGVNPLTLAGLPFSVVSGTYRVHLGFDSMNVSGTGSNAPTPFNGMMLMQHDQYVRPSSTGSNPYFKTDLLKIGTRVYISGQFETTQ